MISCTKGSCDPKLQDVYSAVQDPVDDFISALAPLHICAPELLAFGKSLGLIISL